MSVYTPPALNAVDFALTAFTPANITPYGIALSTYTPPALNAVDFALSSYTPPTFPYVGWELLPSNNITGTASYGQGAGTFDAVASLNFTGTGEFGQGAGTFDATLTTGTPEPPTQGFVGFVPHRRQLKPAIDKLNERRKKKKDKRNIALLLLMSDF